jgi:hypothetical protein
VFQVRSRLVNFRVTEEEFERLKVAATLQGCRCLSEFARSVMLGSADRDGKSTSDPVGKQMTLLERRLTKLESSVAKLAGRSESSGSVSAGVA